MHGNRKYTCKKCLGSGICLHNRNRYHCQDCLGAKCCPHGKAKSGCRACRFQIAKEKITLNETVAGGATVLPSSSSSNSMSSTVFEASRDFNDLGGYHTGLASSLTENHLGEINQLSGSDYDRYNLF